MKNQTGTETNQMTMISPIVCIVEEIRLGSLFIK